MSLKDLGRCLLVQRRAYAAIALIVFSLQFNTVALAAEPRTGHDLDGTSSSVAKVDRVSLKVPPGATACPGSGAGASCATAPIAIAPGLASLPAGLPACATDSEKSGVLAPAACDDILLDAPQAAPGELPDLVGSSPVRPSVPAESLGVRDFAFQRVTLAASSTSVAAGQATELVATASATVTGTRLAIEIFDRTTGTLVAACVQSSRCMVNYAAASGAHTFTAFITPPTAALPTAATAGSSNQVRVSWLDVKVSATSPVVGPGRHVTLTANATIDVGQAGYVLGLYDHTDGRPLTYCARGTSCSTSMTEAVAYRHTITGYIADRPATPSTEFQVESKPLVATWLGVTLEASSTYLKTGGTVYLTAHSNVDLSDTPWSLGIYDHDGRLVDQPCKSSDSCTARVTVAKGTLPDYTAVIGAAASPVEAATPVGQILNRVLQMSTLLNIQARSTAVRPTQILWGVDSCKPFTSDSSANGGLYQQVVKHKGHPDFWGRYITNTYNCPGISAAEIAAAHYRGLGLLPIYNDYDCSAVAGYSNGKAYGITATSASAAKGIPVGTVVVIDIEPPGPWCSGGVDKGFIQGWYDGVTGAGYKAGYYGDSTVGSTFNRAWCSAVAAQSQIADNSFVWTFQPSLSANFNKLNAPKWAPHNLGCPGRVVAWQYVLSSGANPDVDQDEAFSTLPIWYP